MMRFSRPSWGLRGRRSPPFGICAKWPPRNPADSRTHPGARLHDTSLSRKRVIWNLTHVEVARFAGQSPLLEFRPTPRQRGAETETKSRPVINIIAGLWGPSGFRTTVHRGAPGRREVVAPCRLGAPYTWRASPQGHRTDFNIPPAHTSLRVPKLGHRMAIRHVKHFPVESRPEFHRVASGPPRMFHRLTSTDLYRTLQKPLGPTLPRPQ